ncbi:hypothetical protein [Aquisalimonas sp.]|uniref:LBF_2804 family protein n=1 Tax=Aquisalimonas sp. TaxID=1872621 RepID=UPI0025C184AE|nr:hypothetical protein [Aquisalimonas sp.]
MSATSNATPEDQYVANPNIVERWAAAYLQAHGASRDSHLHALDSDEFRALRRLERSTMSWAAAAGALSGGIIGGLELLVFRGLLNGVDAAAWEDQWPYWAAFLAIAGVISVVEIGYLYWNVLRSVGKLSRITGASLEGGPYATLTLRGLTRTALEVPNPRSRVYGIDPYALVPRWKFVAQNIFYRMKVGLSSFILRVLFRHVLARTALRGFIPLLTGPLYAVWNVWITRRIMRHAREQALGPFTVEDLVREVVTQRPHLGPRARRAIVQGVGELMVRNQDAHPNYVYLLARLMEALAMPDRTIDLDWAERRRDLPHLTAPERLTLLRTLAVASVLGGKLRKGQLELLQEAYSTLGMSLQRSLVKELRSRLMSGQRITADDVRLAAPA